MYGATYLEVSETINLRLMQKILVEHIHAGALAQALVDVDDVCQLMQEPLVDLCQFVYLIDAVALEHGFGNDEDALVGRHTQSLVDVVDLQFVVFHKSVHALSYHAETFLDSFLKVAAYCHHLTHGLHGRAELLVYTMEL